jgi:hypothetical protein
MVSFSFCAISSLALLSRSKMSSSDHPHNQRPPQLVGPDPTNWWAPILDRAADMKARAAQGVPFTPLEVAGVIRSIENASGETFQDQSTIVVWHALLPEIAHVSHTNWSVTETNARRLARVLPLQFESSSSSTGASTRRFLERILREGNWDRAARHAATERSKHVRPFAVLVTGVNGIRKTSAMYQPWFPQVLSEALVAPAEQQSTVAVTDLPVGSNSFFRQLDHMIATLCNEEFATLYQLTGAAVAQVGEFDEADTPSVRTVQAYSDLKASIFTRYRTLSELLGVNLLKEAQKLGSNCLMETSGRDVAMFHYVDHFFPSSSSNNNNNSDTTAGNYNKLALHFCINDLRYAQESVDRRMKQEIITGIQALSSSNDATTTTTTKTRAIINANAGGPYGSQVLASVQADSDRVWNDSVLSGVVAHDWYKATIQINGQPDGLWTAQAVRPDGSLGTIYTFEPLAPS